LAWFDSQLGQRAFALFAMLGFAKKSTRVGCGHGEEPAPPLHSTFTFLSEAFLSAYI
jgi:hypothetical protein